MHTRFFIQTLLTLAITAAAMDVAGQCKSFTKRRCMGELGDYNNNGQYNGAVMFEGEEATLRQTFYSNQNYRLTVCSQESISDKLYFEVLDFRNDLIYSSQGKDSQLFDFNVESTQQLKIRIVVPDAELPTNIKKNGCVSILVGFKNK